MQDRFTFDHARFAEPLARYSDHEQRTIDAYFAVIALTRKTRKLADGIIRGEMTYWERFPVPVVLASLREHIRKYAGKSEKYTRGIMRRLAKEGELRGVHQGRVADAIERGTYGQGEDRERYVSADEPLPI